MDLLRVSRDFIRTHSFGLGLFLSTSFLFLAVSFTGLEGFLRSVSGADFSILFISFLVANLPILIYSTIWRKCLLISGNRLTLRQVLNLNLAALFINNITPLGNVGGEPFVAKRISQYTDESFETMFSVILVADLVTFSPILTSILLGSVILAVGSNTYFSFYIISLLMVLATLSFLLYNRGFYISKMVSRFVISSANYVQKVFGKDIGVSKRISDFREGLNSFSSFKLSLLGMSLLAHTGFLADITAIFLISVSIGEPLDFFVLLVIVPLARIANYTPTPGGSGFYEVALSGLLVSLGGIGFSAAVSVTVIYRFITYYFGLLLGYLAFNSQNYNL